MMGSVCTVYSTPTSKADPVVPTKATQDNARRRGDQIAIQDAAEAPGEQVIGRLVVERGREEKMQSFRRL